MALFEGYERRMPQIQPVPGRSMASSTLKKSRHIPAPRAWTPIPSSRASSPSAFENAVVGLHAGRGHRAEEGRARPPPTPPSAIGDGPAGVLHPRLRCRSAQGGPWPRQPGRHAAATRRPSASAFLAGHESFAAAEGAIGIALNANKVRKKPLRVILNGLGKDAAMIISRINGFTYVQTKYDYLYTERS